VNFYFVNGILDARRGQDIANPTANVATLRLPARGSIAGARAKQKVGCES
jgi:hypothetical protein